MPDSTPLTMGPYCMLATVLSTATSVCGECSVASGSEARRSQASSKKIKVIVVIAVVVVIVVVVVSMVVYNSSVVAD